MVMHEAGKGREGDGPVQKNVLANASTLADSVLFGWETSENKIPGNETLRKIATFLRTQFFSGRLTFTLTPKEQLYEGITPFECGFTPNPAATSRKQPRESRIHEPLALPTIFISDPTILVSQPAVSVGGGLQEIKESIDAGKIYPDKDIEGGLHAFQLSLVMAYLYLAETYDALDEQYGIYKVSQSGIHFGDRITDIALVAGKILGFSEETTIDLISDRAKAINFGLEDVKEWVKNHTDDLEEPMHKEFCSYITGNALPSEVIADEREKIKKIAFLDFIALRAMTANSIYKELKQQGKDPTSNDPEILDAKITSFISIVTEAFQIIDSLRKREQI